MTNETTIDILKEMAIRLGSSQGSELIYNALCEAIRVVEKQIPKRPIGDFDSCPHYRCPNCKCSVKMYENDNTYPHCGFCGQALDWSGNK